MMVNLLDDSNFHRQTAVMTRLDSNELLPCGIGTAYLSGVDPRLLVGFVLIDL
jgi:hypothetical protein